MDVRRERGRGRGGQKESIEERKVVLDFSPPLLTMVLAHSAA